MKNMEAIPSAGKDNEADWGVRQRIKIQRDLMEIMGVDLLNEESRDGQIQEWIAENAEKFSDITDDNPELQSRLLSEHETVYNSALEEVKDTLLEE